MRKHTGNPLFLQFVCWFICGQPGSDVSVTWPVQLGQVNGSLEQAAVTWRSRAVHQFVHCNLSAVAGLVGSELSVQSTHEKQLSFHV